MPVVSVVVPTFGRPAQLAAAIQSVLTQSLRDLELIVVVDGYDPASIDVLKGLGDPRVRYVCHDRQQGAAAARDTGVDESAGFWVAFLDDDDQWMPTKLASQLAIAPSEPAVISTLSLVGTPDATISKPGRPYDGSVPIDEWLFDRQGWLSSGGFVQSSSLMVRRTLFETIRFRDMRQHDDWEFVIRAVKDAGHRFVTVPEPLVMHLYDEKRVSLRSTLRWKTSIAWALHMGPVLTPRALSGFLLIVVARSAANAGDYRALFPLVWAALRHGSPSLRQVFAFALLWLVPGPLRRSIRRLMSSSPSWRRFGRRSDERQNSAITTSAGRVRSAL